jgi:hypothetical protein
MVLSKNTGVLDRALRAIVGIVLILLAVFGPEFIDSGILRGVIGFIGLLNLVATLTGHCPVYALVDINTAKHKA